MGKRTSRKSQIIKRGVEEFCFDFYEEYRLWLFVSGIKMTVFEWRSFAAKTKGIDGEQNDCNKNYLYNINTGKDWIDYITNKYKDYTLEQLKEYIRYLNVVKFDKSITGKNVKELGIILLTSFVACLFDDIIMEYLNINMGKSISGLVEAIVDLLFLVFAIGILLPVSINVFSDVKRNAIKNFFIESYIKVIEELISEKEAKDKMGEMPWV